MLKTGELDAVILAALFPSLLNGTAEAKRLFENYKDVEQSLLQKNKDLPDYAHSRNA